MKAVYCLVAILALCALAKATTVNVGEPVAAAEKREVLQFAQAGAYGGLVYQQNPGTWFNVTIQTNQAGVGNMAVFNPAINLHCLGSLQWRSGLSYNYRLEVDRSPAGYCAQWGSVNVFNPANGQIRFQFFPLGSAVPAFDAFIFQYV